MYQSNIRNTMSRPSHEYQHRVVLVPVALGVRQEENLSSTSQIITSATQILASFLKIGNQAASTMYKFDVAVERLDTILDPQHIHIPLMKMDAQGFECNILEGMGYAIADTIKEIKFEYATNKWLTAHGCTDLLKRFRDFEFDVYDEGNLITSEKVKTYR